MPKILKRTCREKRPEKEEYLLSWKCGLNYLAVSQSENWIQYSNKLVSVRQFRSSYLSNCVKRAEHVPLFSVDGFEIRDGKLVYNVSKALSSHIKFQLT